MHSTGSKVGWACGFRQERSSSLETLPKKRLSIVFERPRFPEPSVIQDSQPNNEKRGSSFSPFTSLTRPTQKKFGAAPTGSHASLFGGSLCNFSPRLAFTLAEILIVMSIIGFVAEMTIPTLVANIQKAQYVTALKKAYSNVNQVLIKYSADNGCVGDLKCTGLFDLSNTQENVGDALVPYFKVAEICKGNLGCFPGKVARNPDCSAACQRFDTFRDDNNAYRFTTTDGMAVYMGSGRNNCEQDRSTGVTGDMRQVCGSFWIDVNGDKGPNNMGRDIFPFHITNGRGPKLYPYGGRDDTVGNNGLKCINGSNVDDGFYCTARVIEEGWEMNY